MSKLGAFFVMEKHNFASTLNNSIHATIVFTLSGVQNHTENLLQLMPIDLSGSYTNVEKDGNLRKLNYTVIKKRVLR